MTAGMVLQRFQLLRQEVIQQVEYVGTLGESILAAVPELKVTL